MKTEADRYWMTLFYKVRLSMELLTVAGVSQWQQCAMQGSSAFA